MGSGALGSGGAEGGREQVSAPGADVIMVCCVYVCLAELGAP